MLHKFLRNEHEAALTFQAYREDRVEPANLLKHSRDQAEAAAFTEEAKLVEWNIELAISDYREAVGPPFPPMLAFATRRPIANTGAGAGADADSVAIDAELDGLKSKKGKR